MTSGKSRFIFKATAFIVMFIVFLVLADLSVNATTTRFGNIGWIHLMIGFLTFVAGLIVTWGTAITWLDRRNLRAYRSDPDDAFTDGQSVALSGRVQVDGEPLKAPFSGKACAAFSYQVTGQRRSRSSSSNQYVQQLCLLGFHLAPAVLDCGARQFPLGAIADVDDEYRSTGTGGDWGDLGLERINAGAEALPQASEEVARGKLAEARAGATAPQSVDYFVAPTRTGANQITVIEDIVPVETPVTILGTYSANTRGLDGQRMGGLKVFAGKLDERLAGLDEEWLKGLKIGVPLLAVGLVLLTLAWWLPG